MYDDEAWDEERWEAFLRDHDRRVDSFMELIFRFMQKYPQPAPEDAEAVAAWRDALRAWLRDKGWQHEDAILRFMGFDEEQSEEEQDEEEGLLFGNTTFFADEEEAADVFEALERLPVYQHACALSSEVLDWAHGLSGDVKDSQLVHFCSHVAQIPAHVARGHGIGYERDVIGGNIVCVKRALSDANAALALLGSMKQARYMDARTYRPFYEQVYEVRNELALYVQDLRDLFNLGID